MQRLPGPRAGRDRARPAWLLLLPWRRRSAPAWHRGGRGARRTCCAPLPCPARPSRSLIEDLRHKADQVRLAFGFIIRRRGPNYRTLLGAPTGKTRWHRVKRCSVGVNGQPVGAAADSTALSEGWRSGASPNPNRQKTLASERLALASSAHNRRSSGVVFAAGLARAVTCRRAVKPAIAAQAAAVTVRRLCGYCSECGITGVMVSRGGPARCAQARRRCTTRPRPARPIASSGSDAGSGMAVALTVRVPRSGKTASA
jgi:hypothetical protein